MGFVPVDPSQFDDAQPVAAAIPALPSGNTPDVSALLGNDSPSGLDRFGRTVIGGAAQLLPFNTGDEVIAGLTSATDALPWWLGGSGAPISDAYDQRLKEVRGYEKAFDTIDPVAGAAVNLGGAALMPLPGANVAKGTSKLVPRFLVPETEAALPKLFSEAPGLVSAAGNVVKSALLGGAYGSAGGFGAGEGSGDRLAKAESGGLLGSLLGGGLGALSEGLSGISNFLKPQTAEEASLEKLGKLGIKASDIKNVANTRSVVDGEEPIAQVLGGVRDRGVFSVDPHLPDAEALSQMQARNTAARLALAEQVHGPEGLLAQADAAIKGGDLPTDVPAEDLGWWKSLNDYVSGNKAADAEAAAVKPSANIDYTKANAFIANHPDRAKALQAQFDERAAVTENQFDGTLSSLSKRKTQVADVGYDGSSDSRDLDKAIASDIRNHIEQKANEVVPAVGETPGLGDRIRELNSQQAEHYAFDPIVAAAKDKALSADYKNIGNTGGLANALQRNLGGLKGLQSGGTAYLGSQLAIPHAGPIVAGYKLAKIIGDLNPALTEKWLLNPASGVAAGAAGGAQAIIPALTAELYAKPIAATAQATPQVAQAKAPISLPGGHTLAPIDPSMFDKPGVSAPPVSTPPATARKAQADAILAKAPPLYRAMALAESSGNPDAVSPPTPHGKSYGLFQINENNARALGIDPMDIPSNMSAAHQILSDNLKEFGDIHLALAAYNSRPSVVHAAIAKAGTTDWRKVRDYLPAETKAYLTKVETHYNNIMRGA